MTQPSVAALPAASLSDARPEPTLAALDFRHVYTQHFDLVWRRLLRLGIYERDVADVSQMVFLVAHRKLPEFEHRSELATWLTGICIRVAKDFRQSARVRREVLAGEAVLERSSATEGPDTIDVRQRADVARRILDQLPEEQRTVFVLYELEEMTGQELSEALHIPMGTVRSRLRAARQSFQAAVRREQLREARRRP